MEPSPRELRSYETSSGISPFEDWLENLRDRKARAVIQVRLDRLEQGNFGLCKAVGGRVLELKIDFGPGYRVYFSEDGPRIVLLLLGGDKATQTRDIQIARHYWQQYKENRNA